MKVAGVVYMCTACARGQMGINLLWEAVEVEMPDNSICILCSVPAEIAIPVNVCDDYKPQDWTTTSNPAGVPWWITGYLKGATNEDV